MSLSEHGVDDELRLCLDRGSDDSDSQLALNRSLTELIESITCQDGDEASEVAADIVECILDRVEEGAARRRGAQLGEIDDGARPHDKGKARARKAVRRKKSRRRSTSCSTTSSTSSDLSRKHRRRHKQHRRREEALGPSPRVNPIFLWVKQDDTRIVEVLCEDYDKRNRIRLTKTAHGWRATPRTERLDSTVSRSSLDQSPPPPLVSAEPVQTKEMKSVARKTKRCDKKKERGFKTENNFVDDYKNVDVVNNNHCSISNNNDVKVENSLVQEPRLRSFGYKKACHEDSTVDSKCRKKDNKLFDDIDVYTFVPTPKTDSEDNSAEKVSDFESELKPDLVIKPDPEAKEREVHSELTENVVEAEEKRCCTQLTNEEPEPTKMKSEIVEHAESTHYSSPDLSRTVNNTVEYTSTENEKICQTQTPENLCNANHTEPDKLQEELSAQKTPEPRPQPIFNHKQPDEPTSHVGEGESLAEKLQQQKEDSLLGLGESQCQQSETIQEPHLESNLPPDPIDSMSVINSETIDKSNENSLEQASDFTEEDEDEVILPEPHLQTPEPSPQPVPEPSTAEPEISMSAISLLPDTSLDSDTIHLPDTTTKSETSLLITHNISLGQKLSIKPPSELTLESSLLSQPLHSLSKTVHVSEIAQHPQVESNADMLQQAELERQITADLDEEHLLAIEEILQGEECVEDFDDDDLPEDLLESHESPVNLVIDLKNKDQVDNIGIPLSLRTDDFLVDMFPTSLSAKESADMLPSTVEPKKSTDKTAKQIPPAHQQSKTKFLESILSCPKRCHSEINKKADVSDQQEPLYLGVSRKSASPTVSSSDGRKFSSPELEPKPKRLKVEDITLKTILNRNKESCSKTKVSKSKDNDDTQQTADSTTKSRLLELLTSENEDHINKLDPLTQLKEVLSDPDLNVPDPLLVPRARLPALVANPAKEIPRLLAMKSESLSYPKLLTDPDLLVVSLSHLQSLLQAAGKEEEMMRYQQHAQLLQQQMKQEQTTLDAATATALNQMMWLPYLSQLEAAAMACGNTQDFMTMLNMVFPSGTYSQVSPYMTPPSPGINAYDYKSQLEFQQAFALWNEAMMQAATNQFTAQTLGTNSSGASSKLYQNYPETKYNPKSQLSSKHQEAKHTSARTSPITLNYQQSKYRASQYPYTSMFSIPTATPTTSHPSSSSTYRTTPSTPSQQPYQSSGASRQRSYNYSSYSSLRPTGGSSTPGLPKSDHPPVSSSDLFKSQQRHGSNSSCKSLMNILSKPRQSEVKNHASSKVFPTSTTLLPKETTVRLTSAKQEPPKLKVKQPQHLVDPHSRPRLLNLDDHGEVGSTTGSLTPHVDETHPNLWHPLFSSHQQKSYSSPWQWTTPVTVSGE